MWGILENDLMIGVLKKTNQEVVWMELITGFNQAINSVAPTRVIQCKYDNEPYINQEVLDFIEETNRQLSRTITTLDIGEWRQYKMTQTKVEKTLNILINSSCQTI